MVSYTQNELLSITDFTKSISKILGDIKEHTVEKVGVLKNNKLEAVVISTQEYERLKELEELIRYAVRQGFEQPQRIDGKEQIIDIK